MPSEVLAWDNLNLWAHQQQAITRILDLIEDNRPRAALVKMPTGTGKTGIMAVVSMLVPSLPHVLVVAPFAGLCDQLARTIRERFWSDLGAQAPDKPVIAFVPSTVQSILERTADRGVYVCTIQTLQDLHSQAQYHEAYEQLAARVRMVMFDEGHREPAPKWALAVRGLRKPTAIFTATPYRNDYKSLDVDATLTTDLSFPAAVEQRFIRNVEFLPMDHNRTPRDFVVKLLQFYDGPFRNLKPSQVHDPRVIIRCESKDAVTSITSLLSEFGRRAIGIHHDYGREESDEYHQAVPDPRETDAVFWVHQFKLLEGIDDPRFCLLAIYEPLGNARSLVQQVGRIVRNPGRQAEQTATVLYHPNDQQRTYWNNYLAYEFQPNTTGIGTVRDTLHQGLIYLDGNYRSTFDMGAPDAFRHLSFPLSARVFELPDNFSLPDLVSNMLDEWIVYDRTGLFHQQPEQDTFVCLYGTYENAPILRDQTFLQYCIGYTFWRKRGQYLFYYDSQGITPEYLRENAKRVVPAKLGRLMNGDIRVSAVSLMNTDLGKHSIRRRTLNAYSMAETAPGLHDHGHICSTATATVETPLGPRARRYIGFTRARVTDATTNGVAYPDYAAWLDSIFESLQDPNQGLHSFFRRFSTYTEPPFDPRPRSVMVDVGDAVDRFEAANGQQLDIDELCCEVENGRFDLIANNQPYSVGIHYRPEKQQYEIKSPELARAFRQSAPGSKRTETLVSFLNRTQSFRVIPESEGFIYAHSHFLKVDLGLGTDLDLSRILVPIPSLATANSEKGLIHPVNGDGWDEHSIFGIIDRNLQGSELEHIMHGFNLLVCDDLDSELADFIGLDEANQRVVFIHAKDGRGAQVSATAFAQVCSQAVKNLHFLDPQSVDHPQENIRKWNRRWRDTDIGVVNDRMRRLHVSGAEFWHRTKAVLRNPNATREVWVVMGQGFSIQRFDRNRRRANKPPEVVQVYYQLASTWASVSSVGARLSILCSP